MLLKILPKDNRIFFKKKKLWRQLILLSLALLDRLEAGPEEEGHQQISAELFWLAEFFAAGR